MDSIIKLYFRQRIDQICKSSQSVSIGETTSTENVESVNVSKEFLEVLNISFQLKIQRATALLETKDLIDATESKIKMLFENIITLEAEEKDRKFDDIVALAITYFNMGLVYSDTELQDIVISETHFTTCVTLLKEKELERKAIVTIIRVLIELHTISHKLKQPEKSYSFLNTAMELYSKYTKEEIEYPDPINFNAILGMDDEKYQNSKIILENLQLTTLLSMSTLYEKNFRDKHKFVIYVHNILDQLTETISCMLKAYPFYWAMTSINLFQYFVHSYRFIEARNHMIAAEYMMKMFHEQVIEPLSNEEIDAELYSLLQKLDNIGYNNVNKFWGIYGAELLTASTNKLLHIEENNEPSETDNSKSESVMKSKDLTKLLIFSDERKDFEGFAAHFPDECVSNLNDAKSIFVNVLKCFDTVKKYFTIKEYPTDFLDISIATSKVYKCLATFEQDKSRQIKLHKRRAETLRNISSELENICREKLRSPLFFFPIRKLLIEDLICDMTILDIKTAHLQLNVERLNREFTDEIKLSNEESITNIIQLFECALESFDVFFNAYN
ncbi:KIF-binding protein isoform X1 [Linepithema humile]|uniref:KIF-binding protein isoform X1 n=1 Tax=Linepithema humile TaxID=83485 RepID=UPI00351F0D15